VRRWPRDVNPVSRARVVDAGLPLHAGLGTFAPRLDDAGNSIKGQLAARFLARGLGLDLLASQAGTSKTTL
jgi:hypothetical protein